MELHALQPTPDDAYGVALEHIMWAQQARITPAETVAACGVRWVGEFPPSWMDCEICLAMTWRRLREKLANQMISEEMGKPPPTKQKARKWDGVSP